MSTSQKAASQRIGDMRATYDGGSMRGRHGQGREREELKSRGPRDGIQTCKLIHGGSGNAEHQCDRVRERSFLLVARAWASGGKRNKRENQRGERAKLRVCTVGFLAPCVSVHCLQHASNRQAAVEVRVVLFKPEL